MKINWRNFKNLKAGIYSTTPLQLCDARIAGYIGTIVGSILAMFPLILSKQWGWVVFIFFVAWLQCTALIGDLQQRKILKD